MKRHEKQREAETGESRKTEGGREKWEEEEEEDEGGDGLHISQSWQTLSTPVDAVQHALLQVCVCASLCVFIRECTCVSKVIVGMGGTERCRMVFITLWGFSILLHTPTRPPLQPSLIHSHISPAPSSKKHTILFPLRSPHHHHHHPHFPPSPIFLSFWGSVRKPTLQRQESPGRIRYRRGFHHFHIWTLFNFFWTSSLSPIQLWTLLVLHWTLIWTVLDSPGLFGGFHWTALLLLVL